eukprot:750724-Hanusia_phi.AAC.1
MIALTMSWKISQSTGIEMRSDFRGNREQPTGKFPGLLPHHRRVSCTNSIRSVRRARLPMNRDPPQEHLTRRAPPAIMIPAVTCHLLTSGAQLPANGPAVP